MKLFNEKVILEEASKNVKKYPLAVFEEVMKSNFKDGVEYAESEIKDICIELLEFIQENYFYSNDGWCSYKTGSYVTKHEIFEDLITSEI